MNVGLANAKMIAREFSYDMERIEHATMEELSSIDGVGEVIAGTFTQYFEKADNREALERLLSELNLEQPQVEEGTQSLNGLTFVITGSVNRFANRDELKEAIERKGGKATGSVTAKTSYLINNDVTSNSSKNKKAKELGVPIISEEEIIEMMGES